MAKGNNGNLLQHTVELAVALTLAPKAYEPLYLVATHGMCPYEPFDERPTDSSPSAFRDLELALCMAKEGSVCPNVLPPIIRAYRMCNASNLRYPNSIEVARSMLNDVRGVIVEVVKEKALELEQYYANSAIKVLNQSWRASDAGSLTLPDDLKSPWLLTLDPMIFSEKAYEDDNKLHVEDVSMIKKRFSENESKLPNRGAIVISCYSMQPSLQKAFKSTIESHRFPNIRYAETTARGGNRHIAAIAAKDAAVSDSAINEWQATVEWLRNNSR